MSALVQLPALLIQDPAPAAAGLHWLDLVGLGLLALFGFLGALRGLWWQVIRLLGLAAAVAVARALAPRFGPDFQRLSDLPGPVANGLVWLLLFLAVLVIASLLGNLGRRTLEAVRLGPVDRFGGLVAGLLTALVLHAAFLVAVSYLGPTVWASESLQQAESRRLLTTVTTRLQLYVGAEDAARIRGWFEGDEAQGEPADAAREVEDELPTDPAPLDGDEPLRFEEPLPPRPGGTVH